MATLGLEYFEDFDNNNATALVPKTAAPVNGQFVPLSATDIVMQFTVSFAILGALGAYTQTENTSPYFPYIYVQSLEVPYQSGNLKIGTSDGHIWWIWSVLRQQNAQQMAQLTGLFDQAAGLTTGYTAQVNQSSLATYTVAASTNETYKFTLQIPAALYMRNFYDDDGQGNIGVIPDVYVNPLAMSASGRNITPKVTMAAVQGTTLDTSPFVATGAGTAPAWTDAGSTVTFKRQGWREPGQGRPMPPMFNWAHIFDTFQFTFGATAKIRIPFPDNGQLLCVVFRFFDPTLATNIGGPIPVQNIVTGSLTYGPGLVKYNDAPQDMQRRIMLQHGVLFTSGVWIWDLYANTKSNQLGEVLNTYITAGVVANFDFTGNVPGAGSYATVSAEWLTQVQ